MTVDVSRQTFDSTGKVVDDYATLIEADTYLVPNADGRTRLILKNTDTLERTIVIATPYEPDGLEVEAREIAIDDSETVIVGPFSTRVYNDPESKIRISAKEGTDQDHVLLFPFA